VSKANPSKERNKVKHSEIAKKLLYTPEEAAVLLSMSRSRVYVLLSRRWIGSIKEGRRRLVPVSEVESYIQRRLCEQQAVA
jgi:excisionase family DNA binding protein